MDSNPCKCSCSRRVPSRAAALRVPPSIARTRRDPAWTDKHYRMRALSMLTIDEQIDRLGEQCGTGGAVAYCSRPAEYTSQCDIIDAL